MTVVPIIPYTTILTYLPEVFSLSQKELEANETVFSAIINSARKSEFSDSRQNLFIIDLMGVVRVRAGRSGVWFEVSFYCFALV